MHKLPQPVGTMTQWLTEREVIKPDQAARLKKVRAQLDDCLSKTPDVPEVIELLGSSGSYIDYSTCTKVLAALKADATTVRTHRCSVEPVPQSAVFYLWLQQRQGVLSLPTACCPLPTVSPVTSGEEVMVRLIDRRAYDRLASRDGRLPHRLHIPGRVGAATAAHDEVRDPSDEEEGRKDEGRNARAAAKSGRV